MISTALPFAVANELHVGENVVYGGKLRTITDIRRHGSDCPLFSVKEIPGASAEIVSWQVCGRAPLGEFEKRELPPTNALGHHQFVLSYRVWTDSPSYQEEFRRWKCTAAFNYLGDCLDFIASLQDEGIDCVFQSPADCRRVLASERRVVYKAEASDEGRQHNH